MSRERLYTTRRQGIVKALCEKIKEINGTGNYFTDLDNNVEPRVKFWDEIDTFPAVFLSSGMETRLYQTGGYKDRFLTIRVRCYVNEENAVEALDKLLEDLETIIEENSRLEYFDKSGKTQYTQQITIISIDTDEGVLEPLGIGEMNLEVRY
jgi:hypothetical protein